MWRYSFRCLIFLNWAREVKKSALEQRLAASARIAVPVMAGLLLLSGVMIQNPCQLVPTGNFFSHSSD